MVNILFVCTGNICRSPTAEGILRQRIATRGLSWINTDSAGTHGYHTGEAPDHRSIATAKKRGFDLSMLRARKLQPGDFHQFDLILGLDQSHVQMMERMAPKNAKANIALFLQYAGMGSMDVPDPYYGEMQGFDYALNLIEQGVDSLLDRLHPQETR